MTKRHLLTALMLLAGATAHAKTYQCSELPGDISDEVLCAKYSVTIKELAEITNQVSFGSHFDHVYKVDVKINSTLGSTTTLYKSFQTNSTVSDVDYAVSAVRAQGIKIMIFLDAANESWMEETFPSGRKVTTHLTCY